MKVKYYCGHCGHNWEAYKTPDECPNCHTSDDIYPDEVIL